MPDTSGEAIGKRLVAVREARGYLQGFLVQLLDTSQQRWSNYEKGNRVLPNDLLYKFCKVTGATTDFVLFGEMSGMPMDLVQILRERGYDFNGGAGPGARAG